MDVRKKLVELLQYENNPVWRWFPNNMAMLQLADYLIANGVTVQEWISVDERLPDLIPYSSGIAYSEIVLVLTSRRKETIAVWDGSTWIAQFDYCELWGEKITHWMPLPLPPKGE